MGLGGLKKLREMQEKTQGSGFKRFKISDGQKFKIRLLQELDEESKNYNESAGTARAVVRHTPEGKTGYLNAFECTEDEGQCYGCEKWREGNKDWRGQGRLFVNVLVRETPDSEEYVAVLEQGVNSKNVVTNALLETADDYDTVTNRWWKIGRSGSGISDTTYTFTSFDSDDEVHSGHELFDLGVVLKSLSYDEQVAASEASEESAPKAKREVTSEAMSDEW